MILFILDKRYSVKPFIEAFLMKYQTKQNYWINHWKKISSRSPRKSGDGSRKSAGLGNLMKPSDLLQPSAARGPLRSANPHSKRYPKPADLSDLHKQVSIIFSGIFDSDVPSFLLVFLLFLLCPVLLPLSLYLKYWFSLIKVSAVIHIHTQNLLVCQQQVN